GNSRPRSEIASARRTSLMVMCFQGANGMPSEWRTGNPACPRFRFYRPWTTNSAVRVEDRQSCLSSPFDSIGRRPSKAPRDTGQMPIGTDTFAQARHLPHLQKSGKTYFITFSTRRRYVLAPDARTIALNCCVHDHQVTYWLHVAVIMPDHVHFIITPYQEWSLSDILRRVKGNSARLINLKVRRQGTLWQDESFDRIIRHSEDLQKKCEYVAEN